ncbi:hypothetical protein T552_01985 [Pneumocystis carinii B80]|uniref:Uncharacterized protein n=1 Tax=Pneumocystis carinii (strain B80) TaxID=1408658 RepID=A0A0W4ZIE4_PNEC8|nr:hypothetical protein T552_01985 [Pneumocystis carinii B80]KTW28126.1 hypothetical protein T552_01985 [Pneumocystis carinii B80]
MINHKTIPLDFKAHNHNVYDDFYFSELSDEDNVSSENIQESLTSLTKKLKWQIANKDRDKEKLFTDYENLQKKYNSLLLSYESLQASSSRQLADLKAKLSSLTSEMNRNMDCLHEELEIKTLHLNELKQKLEKLKKANCIANENIKNLQMEFDQERSRWEEEKIKLTLSKNSLKRNEISQEFMLLHKYFENMKLKSLETKENSYVSAASSINIKNDDIIASSSSDNFFPGQSLAEELSLCFDKDKNLNSDTFVSIDFLDINNSSQSQLDKISLPLNQSILNLSSDDTVYFPTNINTSITSSTNLAQKKLSQLTLSTQTLPKKKTSILNMIQISTNDSFNLNNNHSFQPTNSKNYLLKNQRRSISTATYFSKFYDSKISPPLPIPIRRASLIFKKIH